jgi:hypothetical protein
MSNVEFYIFESQGDQCLKAQNSNQTKYLYKGRKVEIRTTDINGKAKFNFYTAKKKYLRYFLNLIDDNGAKNSSDPTTIHTREYNTKYGFYSRLNKGKTNDYTFTLIPSNKFKVQYSNKNCDEGSILNIARKNISHLDETEFKNLNFTDANRYASESFIGCTSDTQNDSFLRMHHKNNSDVIYAGINILKTTLKNGTSTIVRYDTLTIDPSKWVDTLYLNF